MVKLYRRKMYFDIELKFSLGKGGGCNLFFSLSKCAIVFYIYVVIVDNFVMMPNIVWSFVWMFS